jgi:ABC-type uncharacterized transport system involved in gliding motility auxiliary subunit
MKDGFELRPEMSGAFDYGAEETMGEKILAASLEGTFPSWFEGVDKPKREKPEWADESWDEDEQELPPMPSEPKESRIVVVGDSDMCGVLSSSRYVPGLQAANFNFLLQAADWLGKDDDIVGIRYRQGGIGRLDRITDEGKRDGVKGFARILNVVIVPIVIVAFGIFRLVKRSRKKERHHAL